MQPEIPNEWNGRPTKYHIGDGFTQSGILGKAAYILGFPAISVILEVFHYNKETRNGEEAAAALAKQATTANGQDMNPSAPQDGRVVASLTQQYTERGGSFSR